MKILPAAFFLISILVTLSCDKEETSPFGLNCENLKNGIISSDEDLIGKEISKLIQDLVPKPTTDDSIGHLANIELIFERLRPCGETSAQIVCYGCGEINQQITELLIMTYSGIQQYVQVIDIISRRDSVLAYRGIHKDDV
jgi:hypothetical protein